MNDEGQVMIGYLQEIGPRCRFLSGRSGGHRRHGAFTKRPASARASAFYRQHGKSRLLIRRRAQFFPALHGS
jgi:hypothetical protein